MEAKFDYLEQEITVDFDARKPERETLNYPGAPGEITINSVQDEQGNEMELTYSQISRIYEMIDEYLDM